MATTPVLGNGPFEYTDPATGKQVSIPLNALNFSSGQLSINSSSWPATPPPFVNAILSNLAQQGLIVPMPAASPKPAMAITATDPGSAGNNIQVAIAITSPSNDPTQAKFRITITETDNYKGLSLNSGSSSFIENILGSDSVQGSKPGLAHVLHASLATTGTPATVAAFKAASVNAKAQADVKTADATPKLVFTLEAKRKGKDGELTTATVGPNASDPSTFDLSLTWTKQVANLTLANVQANAAALAYDVQVAPPASGIFSVPAVGTVQLTGGTDGSSSTAASAVIFSA